MNWHEQIIVTRAVKDDCGLMSSETRIIFYFSSKRNMLTNLYIYKT